MGSRSRPAALTLANFRRFPAKKLPKHPKIFLAGCRLKWPYMYTHFRHIGKIKNSIIYHATRRKRHFGGIKKADFSHQVGVGCRGHADYYRQPGPTVPPTRYPATATRLDKEVGTDIPYPTFLDKGLSSAEDYCVDIRILA